LLGALVYGLLASSGLMLGALIGLFATPSRRVIAVVIAFGSGVLISALAFELMEEAFETGSAAYVVGGFLVGAVVYVLADYGLDRMAARSSRREGLPRTPRSASACRPRSSVLVSSSSRRSFSATCPRASRARPECDRRAARAVTSSSSGVPL